MLKFEEDDCIWSRTETYYDEELIEVFNFNCMFNKIWSSYKYFCVCKRCAIFYKL